MSPIRCLVALLVCAPVAAYAGPLDPPAGPVGPTFKTLVEVEPRRIIMQPAVPQAPDAVVVITEPGSYYLGSDITATDRHGIRIAVGGVTLDLNGFTIDGPGAAVPARVGVTTGSLFLSHIAVRNGSITNFHGSAVGGMIEGGVFENLRVRTCGSGVALSQGLSPHNICRGCTFGGLRNSAVVLGEGAVIEGNLVDYFQTTPVMPPAINGGSGSRIARNVLRNAPSIGIVASTGCVVEGNQLYQCVQDGIQVNGNGLASVTGNTVVVAGSSTANGAGIRLGTAGVHVEGNVVMNCDLGIVSPGGNSIVRNTLRANGTALQTGAGDLVGPAVNAAGAAGATNPLCNLVY